MNHAMVVWPDERNTSDGKTATATAPGETTPSVQELDASPYTKVLTPLDIPELPSKEFPKPGAGTNALSREMSHGGLRQQGLKTNFL
jgi:hypothetical protein